MSHPVVFKRLPAWQADFRRLAITFDAFVVIPPALDNADLLTARRPNGFDIEHPVEKKLAFHRSRI